MNLLQARLESLKGQKFNTSGIRDVSSSVLGANADLAIKQVGAIAQVAQALCELRIPAARTLCLQALQNIFDLVLRTGIRSLAWYAILEAAIVLSRLGERDILIQMWQSVRCSQDRIPLMAADSSKN